MSSPAVNSGYVSEDLTRDRSDPSSQERLIVFSDDWGRHPSSCQHLVRHLLSECSVTWVNTIGTRRPAINLNTLRRGLEKIRDWEPGWRDEATSSEPSPTVLNPVMWPSFRGGFGRSINRRLLSRVLRRRVPHIEDCVGLTTIPIVADLIGTLPLRSWVYYCVDDFSQWPGLDSPTMESMERKLVSKVDRIVVAGDVLQAHIARLGRTSSLITHGVDLAHWTAVSDGAIGPKPLADLPRPLVLFWGLIDRRLDLNLLTALSQRLKSGSIVLVGPQQDADPRLSAIPRLHCVGSLSYHHLPSAAAISDVLVMPYADLPVTRAMQPLKLKEYMATGKPVVSRRLPAVEPWSDALDAVETAEQFAAIVTERLTSGLPHNQQIARIRLNAEDWASKARTMRKVLFP